MVTPRKSSRAGILSVCSVAWGNMDNDGDLDLAIGKSTKFIDMRAAVSIELSLKRSIQRQKIEYRLMTLTKIPYITKPTAMVTNGVERPLQSGSPEYESTLPLIYRLCQMLIDADIVYCHWKSNAAIDLSASGENDLDLLISRHDAVRFTEILSHLGFKEAYLTVDKQLPGVLDYYGYDEEADKLVHVHAHYQLVLGHDTAKNYRLPIEEPFLASAVPSTSTLFKIPTPEFELIVFVMRMVLKHRTWDAMLGLDGKLAKTEQLELDYLLDRADLAQVHQLVEKHLPYVSIELFDRCLQSLSPESSLALRYQVGRQLQKSLQAHTRKPFAMALWLKFWRRALWGTRKYVFRKRSRKQLAAGGAIIAFVGGDGSGKSTAVEESYNMLAKTFATRKVHLGKPPWALDSFLVKGLLKVGRWLGIFPDNKIPVPTDEELENNGALPEFPGYPWLLWHVLTARDRYRLYAKIRRFASNGGIVICDRYPLPEIKSMDGERAGWLAAAAPSNRLLQYLVTLERRFYQHIAPPDLLMVMRVDPDVAVQRRPDEDGPWVRARNEEIWTLDWQQTDAHVIDAGQSQETVISEVKSLMWSRL